MLCDAYLTIICFLQPGYSRYRSSGTLYCDPNVYLLEFQQITLPSSLESNSSRRVPDTQYEGIMIYQNMRHYPHDTASHPRRLQSALHKCFAQTWLSYMSATWHYPQLVCSSLHIPSKKYWKINFPWADT